MRCPREHVEYGSQMLADNAITLHLMRCPWCVSIEVFACGDHFHIGHNDPKLGKDCKARDAEVWEGWMAERGRRASRSQRALRP